MSRQQTERETRERIIIAAARHLFFARGFAETSMEDIARTADYTRRTLYTYVTNRDEICLLVLLEGLQTLWTQQRERMARARTGRAKVRAWGTAFYNFTCLHPEYLRMQLHWEHGGFDDTSIRPTVLSRLSDLNEEVTCGLRIAFREGIRDGSLRRGLLVEMTISHYTHTLRSVLHNALYPAPSGARFDAGIYFRQYLNLFLRGIGRTVSRPIRRTSAAMAPRRVST